MEINTQTKKINWLFIMVPVIILIAVAAFIGGSLIRNQNQAASDELKIDRSQAEQMPQSDPDVFGIVKETDGDTLIVNEFSINDSIGMTGTSGVVVIEINNDDNNSEVSENLPSFINDDEGVTVEVVITKNTEIYKDVSMEGNEIVLQEGVEPDSLDLGELPEEYIMKIEPGIIEEIGPTSFITVWGEKTGNRIIADFVLYQAPLNLGSFDFSE